MTPNEAAAGSGATLVLSGGGFDGSTTVQLLGAGTPVNAASVSVDTFTQLTATFDLPANFPQGSYAVRVVRATERPPSCPPR